MRSLALAALLAGCGEGLSPPYLVADVRIVAVRAEPAEGPAGTPIALDSLVVAPEEDAAIDQLWFACPALAGAATAGMPCQREAAVPLGTGPSVSAVLPEGTTQLIVTTAAALAGAGGLQACLEGFEASGVIPDGCRIALKRVNVLPEGEAANRNPTIEPPVVDGERVAVAVADPDGDAAMFLSWFVTAGELEDYRTDADPEGLENEWTPAEESGRLYVVVRDGEGGEAWTSGAR